MRLKLTFTSMSVDCVHMQPDSFLLQGLSSELKKSPDIFNISNVIVVNNVVDSTVLQYPVSSVLGVETESVQV